MNGTPPFVVVAAAVSGGRQIFLFVHFCYVHTNPAAGDSGRYNDSGSCGTEAAPTLNII